jgi:hypothetical protein
MLRLIRTAAVVALISMIVGCAGLGSENLLAKDLDGFEARGNANWSFSNGAAQASSGTAVSFLVTKDDYKDFELDLEVFVGDPHNSGVFIRCSDRANLTVTNCYEINIFDKRPDQSGRTGGAPGFFKPLAQVDAANRWSTMKIRAEGPHIFVAMNGVTTIDNDGPLLANGPIALQWGEGDVRFRNVRIRRLN